MIMPDDLNPYGPPRTAIDALPADRTPPDERVAAETFRRAHLGAEGWIKALGWLLIMTAFLFGCVGTLGGLQLAPRQVELPEENMIRREALIATPALMVLAALSLVLGFGLKGMRRWARWASVAFMAILLVPRSLQLAESLSVARWKCTAPPLVICTEAGLAALVLSLLLSARASPVFSDGYTEIVDRTPDITCWEAVVFKFVTSLLILVVWLVIEVHS
jgi:hypothetical protein